MSSAAETSYFTYAPDLSSARCSKLAGRYSFGGVPSNTLTWMLAESRSPLRFVAVQVIFDWPNGKFEPDSGSHLTSAADPSPPEMATSYLMPVPSGDRASAVIASGR